jgi:hypothetical protein
MIKIVTLTVAMILFYGAVSFAVNGTATLSTVTGTPGTSVSVPLNVTNFTSVSSIGLMITIDPTLLTFTNLTSINTLVSGMTGNYNPTTHSVNIAWSSNSPPFPNVNGLLCNVNFTFIGPGPATLVFAASSQVTTGFPPADIVMTYTNGLVNTTYKPVNLTVFFEGFFNSGTRTMNQAQGCTNGESTFNNFTGTIVDTVSVLLAGATSPWGYVRQIHGVKINPDGTLTAYIPTTLVSNYYIIVRQRQAVETWSATAVSFSGNPVTYNFTTAANKAYGSNQIQVASGPALYGFYSGDFSSASGTTQDGYIDIVDNNNVFNSAQNGSFGYMAEDVSGDGFTDISDMVLVFNNMQNGVGMNTPPNPAK